MPVDLQQDYTLEGGGFFFVDIIKKYFHLPSLTSKLHSLNELGRYHEETD